MDINKLLNQVELVSLSDETEMDIIEISEETEEDIENEKDILKDTMINILIYSVFESQGTIPLTKFNMSIEKLKSNDTIYIRTSRNINNFLFLVESINPSYIPIRVYYRYANNKLQDAKVNTIRLRSDITQYKTSILQFRLPILNEKMTVAIRFKYDKADKIKTSSVLVNLRFTIV